MVVFGTDDRSTNGLIVQQLYRHMCLHDINVERGS